MKILILSNIFPPGFIGGYELGALEVAIELQNMGHEIKVLTSDYFLDDLEELKALNIDRSLICYSTSHEAIPLELRVKKELFYDFHNIRTLGSTIRRFNPNVVLLFNINGLGPISILQYLDKNKIPTVLYLMDNIFRGLESHFTIYKKYKEVFGSIQFGTSIKIIAMSKNIINEVVHAIDQDLGVITYIPGWVDLRRVNASLIIPKEGGYTRFVFSSRVAPHKGIDIIIDAAAKLIKNGFQNFIIDVFGAGEVSLFIQKVKAMRLDKHISYQGLVSKNEMLSVFSKYDILLFPTWEREPFGFVVSEAAAAGCFPILTNGIGASEWFFDNYDCIKIRRNVDSLYAAMLQTILASKQDIYRMRTNALRLARSNFSLQKWLPVIEQTCMEMTNKMGYKDHYNMTRQIESAFMILNSMLADTLNGSSPK